MVISLPKLQLRVMYGSVMISMAHVTTWGHGSAAPTLLLPQWLYCLPIPGELTQAVWAWESWPQPSMALGELCPLKACQNRRVGPACMRAGPTPLYESGRAGLSGMGLTLMSALLT